MKIEVKLGSSCGGKALQDNEGYFYIVDRAKDLVITGGVNVYPTEVESVIMDISEIADVAVIGVPDPKWGESLKAIVVVKAGYELTEQDIISYCKNHLAGFKVPKSVDFVLQIPRTPTGKILKRELRKPYWGDTTIQIS